jgi:hypothetical protein
VKSLPALLLLVGVLRHYGWELVRPEWQAEVWNISGAVVITGMLWAISYRWRATVLIAIWWTFEELQVAICSAWWIADPWIVPEGEAQCSSLIGFDLGSVGILCAAIVLACLAVRSDRSKK